MDERDEFGGVREQGEVTAAGDDVDGAVAQQARHQPGVDGGDDRVVVPGHEQHGHETSGQAEGFRFREFLPNTELAKSNDQRQETDKGDCENEEAKHSVNGALASSEAASSERRDSNEPKHFCAVTRGADEIRRAAIPSPAGRL